MTEKPEERKEKEALEYKQKLNDIEDGYGDLYHRVLYKHAFRTFEDLNYAQFDDLREMGVKIGDARKIYAYFHPPQQLGMFNAKMCLFLYFI